MAKEAVLQSKKRTHLKEENAAKNTMPFLFSLPVSSGKRKLGIADGKYQIPDDIDRHNDEIAEMFGYKNMSFYPSKCVTFSCCGLCIEGKMPPGITIPSIEL